MAGMDMPAAGSAQGTAASNEHFSLELLTPKVDLAGSSVQFRIVGRHGGVLRDYTPEYTKRLHLVLVRRDFTGYRHLHPTLDADGTWATPVRFGAPGRYRLIADFTPEGGDKTALATDLIVGSGSAPTIELPASSATDHVDGYTVTLSTEDIRAKHEGSMFVDVEAAGRQVELQPYLGSLGHTVVLRTTDFAYLHVHPFGGPSHADSVRFDVTLPSSGTYVVFTQFQVDGVVHTARFVLDAAG
ncbi:MAG: hypothetical protein JWM98_1635 [Thermoleophilia bacterium]|nr:hypothetical protein [Thermoleophilia bacterium]